MKAVGTGDLHLSGYSTDPIVEGIAERLYYIIMVMKQIADYAVANNIRYYIIAGDTFHTKSIIHSVAQSMLLDFVREYQDVLEFIVVDGNHDMSSKSGDGISALKCLDSEPNVRTIHEKTIIDNILFVPWTNHMIDDIKEGGADYLVSHFGLNEAQLNSGISIVSDIGLKDLKHFKRVFLGHYHMPQEVGNVINIGSPIQLDRGEKNDEKRFIVLDTDEDTVLSVPTTGYKKFIEFEISNENKEEMLEKARKLKEEGHVVSLVKNEEVITDDIDEEFRIIDKTERDITNRGIDTSMSTLDILTEYLRIKEIPQEKQESYLSGAIDIINKIKGESDG